MSAIRADLPAGQLFKVVEQCTEQLAVLSRQLLGLRGGELEMVEVTMRPVRSIVNVPEGRAIGALGRSRVNSFKKSIVRVFSSCLPGFGSRPGNVPSRRQKIADNQIKLAAVRSFDYFSAHLSR